jgi:guanine nucleotide-binding protein subunit alpha
MMQKNEIKMLLLGAGESGKSTVLKQMRFIYHDGYNAEERETYKEIIYSNTIQSMRCVLLNSFLVGFRLAAASGSYLAGVAPALVPPLFI